MPKRKLISQGNRALTLTLPISWLKKNSLQAGDQLNITEQDNHLLISRIGESKLENRKIAFPENNHKHNLRSLIASYYKAGYDEIIFNFKTSPHLEELNEIINSFTGLEVVSQGKNTIQIRSFLKTAEEEVENLIIKMFQITCSTAQTLEENWERTNLKNLHSTVLNLKKLRDHCLRSIHLNRYGGDKSYDYYDLVTQLEKVAVSFYYLAEYVKACRPDRSKLITKLSSNLERFYRIYLKKDSAAANRSWLEHHLETKQALGTKNLPLLLKKEDRGTVVYFYHLMMSLRQLASRLLSLSS